MSPKKMRDIAIVILIIFAVTVIVYPLIFSPDQAGSGDQPVELELNK